MRTVWPFITTTGADQADPSSSLKCFWANPSTLVAPLALSRGSY